MKIKAHTDRQDAAEEDLEGWLDEAADQKAKVGALDRSEAWGNAVGKLLTHNLRHARAVMTWLAQGVWTDGRMLGKIEQLARSADADMPKAHIKGHTWM